MKRIILVLIFFVLLIGQQSQVVEKVAVYDRVLGVEKEEYRWNWKNVEQYFRDLKYKIKKVLPK